MPWELPRVGTVLLPPLASDQQPCWDVGCTFATVGAATRQVMSVVRERARHAIDVRDVANIVGSPVPVGREVALRAIDGSAIGGLFPNPSAVYAAALLERDVRAVIVDIGINELAHVESDRACQFLGLMLVDLADTATLAGVTLLARDGGAGGRLGAPVALAAGGRHVLRGTPQRAADGVVGLAVVLRDVRAHAGSSDPVPGSLRSVPGIRIYVA